MIQQTGRESRSRWQIAFTCGSFIVGLLSASASFAGPPASGSHITNQAEATFLNTRLGITERIQSNTGLTEVLPSPRLEVSGGQEVFVPRASSSQYNFRAENTGNVPLETNFAITELANDDFNNSGQLFIDSNNNGIIDRSDIVVDPNQPIRIEPDDQLALIYTFITPGDVNIDDIADSELNATAVPPQEVIVDPAATNPINLTSRGRTVITTANLSLQKSAVLLTGDQQIRYTINARNNSSEEIALYNSVEREPLIVDGRQFNGVLIRDQIPLNTVFHSAVDGPNFDVVYHLHGQSAQSYTRTIPEDLRDVEAVGFLRDTPFGAGQSSTLSFTVSVSPTITQLNVMNTALGYSDDGNNVRASNDVTTPVRGGGQSINFLTGLDNSLINSTPFDRNILVSVGAAACNITNAVDEISILITTANSGDQELLTARETGPNTGEFITAQIGLLRSNNATQLNNVIEGMAGDRINATADTICLGETLTSDIGLQPGGFVFDSTDNAPIAGAEVLIFEQGNNNDPFNQTISDAEGYFDLGLLPAGDYRLDVIPPFGYSFSSIREFFPSFNRRIDPQISFGDAFTFDEQSIVNFDVPLDPNGPIPLTIDKTSDRTTVRRGGFVVYTLTATNETDQALLNAEIIDQLPPGLLYIEGSARHDGQPFADAPVLTNDGILTFDLGTLTPTNTTEVTYGVRIGTATRQSKKTNIATLSGERAGTGVRLTSQEARSTITIDDRGGVFSDEAVVIGRVFLDKNGDGIQTEKDDEGNKHHEPGVPGVKIVTSNGLSVVTDENGRYSLFGLRPTTGVLALQKSTLPKSSTPIVTDVDDVEAAGSRLIDLKRGELRAEDFPLSWTPKAAADVEVRLERFEGLDNRESRLRDDLPLTFEATTRNASRNESGIDTATELLTVADQREEIDTDGDLAIIKTPIEDLVANLDPKLGFVGITNGHETSRPSLTLRVKGPGEAKLRLEVNGEAISNSQIGAKVTHTERGVQAIEYVALRLQSGENKISVILTDRFGNDRGNETITVYAPGKPTGIVFVVPENAPADSRARIPVAVRIVDDAGRLVRVPAEVTLTAQNGTWDVQDIRDATHGLQAYIDNGEATFDFIPPDLVGNETIGIEADFATVKTQIAFSPDLNERVFAGVIEGAIRFGEDGSDLEGLIEDDEISSFEETTEGVRGQLYLKGKILGQNLLTLRYDSDQDTEERLFRDIRRDEFYPVYGDNSERGFDAHSNSKIYVKVEREQSFILYGDIAVEPQADTIRLGALRRSLTGGRAHIEKGPVTVDLFIAETDDNQRVLEQRGRGVSGPYDFDLDGIVEGSEIIEIITRDRDQPSVIISEQRQTRFSDYTLDFFRGALIFNRPIPLIDEDLNPVSIRVTFETEEGSSDNYLIYGGEVRVEPFEGLAVGYREVHSNAAAESDERRKVRSAYVEAGRGGFGNVQVELSQTENRFDETGYAGRISYEYRSDRNNIRAEAARTDEDFDIPNSSLAPGREEIRVTTDHFVTERFSINTDSLYTRDLETNDRRFGTEVLGRYSFDQSFDLKFGTRAVETRQSDDTTNEVYSGIIGATWRPHFLPNSSLNLEFEQDFTETNNWRLSTGGEYQWNPTLRLYALNEISSTNTGFFGLGDGASTNFITRIGAEYEVTSNIESFSEYRQGANGGGNSGAANGIKAKWDLTENLTMRVTAEHVEPLNEGDNRSSAATLGFAYENNEQGLILRNDIEVERDERGLGINTNTAIGYELNEDLTLLFRNRFATDLRSDDRLRDRLRFGAAYRPEHDTRLRGLGLYELEIDDDSTQREVTHRWSFGGAYHPSNDIRLNARYSGEHVDFDSDNFSADSTLHLMRAGAEVDFGFDFTKGRFGGDRFALGGNVSAFTDNDGDNVTLGVGVELKANIIQNVQIGIGYNHIDIEEERLRDLYQSGFYARLRIKLDDSIWDEFDRVGFTSGFRAIE